MLALFSRLLHRDPLFFVAWSAIGGISGAHAGIRLPFWIAVIGAAALLGAGRRWGWRVLDLAAVAVLFLGWASHGQGDPATLAKLWGHEEAQEAELRGTVVKIPDESAGRPRITVEVDTLVIADEPPIREPLLCHVWGPLPELRMGERIRVSGMLTALAPPRNPEERSRRVSSPGAGVAVAELQVASHKRLRSDGMGWQGHIIAAAESAREVLSQTISRGLPGESEEVALLNAMVLGSTAEISPESEEAFRRSGGMHIFSVSGLHVGIFGSVAWLILRAFGVSRRPAIAVIVVLGLAYAFVTGLRPPAVRAAIMLAVFLGGFVIRRQPRILNSAGLAAMVILAFSPEELFTVGFQLSFAVMVAIGSLAGPLRQVTQRWLAPDPFIPPSLVPAWRRRVQTGAQYFADIVTVSAAAFVGSGLLLWWYFGTITPAGLIANCALIPLAWFVMALATLSMLFGAIRVGFLSAFCNQINFPVVGWVKQSAICFAALPGGHFQVTPLSEVSLYRPQESRPADLVVFDAGLGSGPQVIQAGQGRDRRTWLIDCGDESGYQRTVRPWLRRHASRGLDGLILTHADKAHVGAHAQVREDFAVQGVWATGVGGASPLPRQSQGAVAEAAAGSRWTLGPDTAIEVVFPPEGFPPQSRADDGCLVLLISLGPWRVLSMADSGFRTEKWLLRHRPDLHADVVVMGRHGADFCGLREFFRAVGPRAVIASSQNFPRSEAIPEEMRETLREAGIVLFDQGKSGAVEMSRDGGGLVLRGFVDGAVLRME